MENQALQAHQEENLTKKSHRQKAAEKLIQVGDKGKKKLEFGSHSRGNDFEVKAGMVGKQTENVKIFKQRYLVLSKSGLTLYQNQTDKKPVGKISAKNMKSVRIAESISQDSKLFCFTVELKNKKNNLTLACTDKNEREEWITMLTFVINGKDAKLPNRTGINTLTGRHRPDKEIAAASDSKLGGTTRPSSSNNARNRPNMAQTDGVVVSPRSEGGETASSIGAQKKLMLASVGRRSRGFDLPNRPPLGLTRENAVDLSGFRRNQSTISIFDIVDCAHPVDKNETLFEKLDRLNVKESKFHTELDSEVEIELDHVEINHKQGIARVRALHDYLGRTESELSFRKYDEWILVERKQETGWWLGIRDHREGYFPSAYVTVVETFEVKAKEAKKEKEKVSKKEKEKKKEKERKANIMLGNFQIGERIGKGQFGSVFRGINVENGEMVAIKQVDAGKVNKKEIASIMSELELLKELNHINILSYKGFIKTSEHINIVLDYVEGGSLASILAKFGVIPEKLAVCYVKQILQGLHYLHSREVVHRDIKCGNILVTKDGLVKLADFGIATKLGDPNAQAVGSPYWMAPEVIELRGSTSAADIWALGCTIIELLTGQPPYFEYNQVQAMFCMVENERPPFPDNISSELSSFLECCFQRNPEDRWSAKQLMRHGLVVSPGDEFSSDEEEEVDTDLGFDLNGLPDFSNESSNTDYDMNDLAAGAASLDFGSFDLGSYSNTSASTDDLGFDLDGLDASNLGFDLSEEDFDESEESGDQIYGQQYGSDDDESTDDVFLKQDQVVQELLNWFHEAMDKGSVTHAMRIRKTVRDKLIELKTLQSLDARFEVLVQQVSIAMMRCEDEMGQYIPVDSDEED